MWTCYKGRCEAATVLLTHGANPNVKGEVRTQPKYRLYFDLLTMLGKINLNRFVSESLLIHLHDLD